MLFYLSVLLDSDNPDDAKASLGVTVNDITSDDADASLGVSVNDTSHDDDKASNGITMDDITADDAKASLGVTVTMNITTLVPRAILVQEKHQFSTLQWGKSLPLKGTVPAVLIRLLVICSLVKIQQKMNGRTLLQTRCLIWFVEQ